MNTSKTRLASAIASALLLFAFQPAHAVPSLQLDIAGGTYVGGGDETVYAGANSFALYAYGLGPNQGGQAINLSDTYYLAMALVPMTGPASSTIGSFSYKVNGGSANTVNVTGDMTYGVPPLELTLAAQGHDGQDLGQHGIYETYYKQVSFNFSSTQQSLAYNTQTGAGSGPLAGTGMYYVKFDVDLAGLPVGYGIHFDLYNETISQSCTGPKGNKVCTTDIDVNKFAPFSHDAQGMVTTPVPEPETYAMLLAGLGLMGFVARRRKTLVAVGRQ